MIIAFEGNVGSGKSKTLEEYRKLIYIKDKLGIFNENLFKYEELVEKYYTDKLTYSFPFQFSMLVRKSRNMREAINSKKEINVIERVPESNYCVFATKCYEDGFITQEMFQAYQEFYRDIAYFEVQPDVYIYYKTTPEFCLKRIQNRRRKGEELITLNYLQNLHERYEKWINTKPNKIIIDVSKNFSSDELYQILTEAQKYGKQNKKLERTRPSDTQYYLNIAEVVSQRSTCLRRQYGAVIVNDGIIISTGYNGSPKGKPNCIDGSDHCYRIKNNIPHGEDYSECKAIHAEMNAITFAGRKACIGSTLYLYGKDENGKLEKVEPCNICCKLIINSGIKQVVTPNNTYIVSRHTSGVYCGEAG